MYQSLTQIRFIRPLNNECSKFKTTSVVITRGTNTKPCGADMRTDSAHVYVCALTWKPKLNGEVSDNHSRLNFEVICVHTACNYK